MKYLIIGLAPLILLGCKATDSATQQSFEHLSVVQGEILDQKWSNLKRFPPLYPIEEARASNEGCATVEYVVTPNYEIEDIKVVQSTSKYFAKEAKKNVAKWKWGNLPKGIIKDPIKTQTRFEFCLEQGDGHCSELNLSEITQCSGSDVIASVGYRIKH